MDSDKGMGVTDKGTGVTNGSWREKKKRGRPRKYGLDAPIIHSVSLLPGAQASSHSVSLLPRAQASSPGFPSKLRVLSDLPPPGIPSKLCVLPVKNHNSLANGSVSASASQSNALHSAVSGNLGLATGSVSAGGSQSKAVSEFLVSTPSGAKRKLLGGCPEPEYKSNMETEEIGKYKSNMETEEIGNSQAQMQMHQFASTFETAQKNMKELERQVPDLFVQIRKSNEQKASWAEKKKKLERARDETRAEALKAVGEKRDLEKKLEKCSKEAEDAKASAKKALDKRRDLKVKLEKTAKQAESAEASAKKAINEVELKFVDEKRLLEEKLEKAVKQVEDVQASSKKAVYEAVVSATNYYKICFNNFVASLGNGEGKSLEDYLSEVVKAIPYDARATADMGVEVSGHEGDGDKKDEI